MDDQATSYTGGIDAVEVESQDAQAADQGRLDAAKAILVAEAASGQHVAPAATTNQHVATPKAGDQVVVDVAQGVEYEFDFHRGDADFVFSDNNLVILVHTGGEIILRNFGPETAGDLVPPLNFSGDIVSAFTLLSDTASAEDLASIAPAAGPGGGPGILAGPAGFSPFAPGPLPPSIDHIGPVSPTQLLFGAPELTPFVFTNPEAPLLGHVVVGPNTAATVDEDALGRTDVISTFDQAIDNCLPPIFPGNEDVESVMGHGPDGETNAFSGTLNIDFGPGGPGNIAFSTDNSELSGLASDGHAILLKWDGTTLTGYYTVPCGDGQDEADVFTIHVDNVATRAYTFTLLRHLDHLPGDGENHAQLNFNFTATDGLGNSAAGTLPVDVEDDIPVANNTVSGSVDEDALSGGNTDTLANMGHGPDGLTAVATGSLNVAFGADGAASSNPIAFSTTGPALTSGGATVNYVGDGAGGLIGYTGGNSALNHVFTLTTSGGNYSFTLLKPIDHGSAGEDNKDLSFNYTATDGDGDTAAGALTIHVEDDIPVAANDTVSGNEGGPITGNVLTNDSFGADGKGSPAIVSVNGNTDATDGTTDNVIHVTSAHGSLAINNLTGAYTFTAGTVASNQTDTFSYVIKDGDNDTATASLSVAILNVNDTPVAGGASLSVDEDALTTAGGASFNGIPDGDSDNKTASGSLGVSFGADGADGTNPIVFSTTGPALTSGGQTIKYDWPTRTEP